MQASGQKTVVINPSIVNLSTWQDFTMMAWNELKFGCYYRRPPNAARRVIADLKHP